MYNISVVGGSSADEEHYDLAYSAGKKLAEKGAVVICGGLTGIMEAVAKGVKDNGGISVGILPGEKISDANPYITVAIPTGIGFARNFLVVRGGEAVIAIDGASGTMSELYFALSSGRSVIGLGKVAYLEAGNHSGKYIHASSPSEAVETALAEASAFRKSIH